MKLQFSLATLLCIVAVAVDAAVCSTLLVRERMTMKYYRGLNIDENTPTGDALVEIKPPHVANIDENTPTGERSLRFNGVRMLQKYYYEWHGRLR